MTGPHKPSQANAKDFLWLLAPLVPVALLFTWYIWLPPLLVVLLVRHLRKPKPKRVEERLADKELSRRKFEDRYLLPLLQRYKLPDSAATRALLKRWLEHQGKKSREEKQARVAALIALEDAGFAQPPPRTFLEANAEMENRIGGEWDEEKDRAAFQHWLKHNYRKGIEQ
jgi:hypothetical protein